MLRAWRITKKKYSAQAFSGDGARMYGSRWSTPGIRIGFASETLSLAILEVLVHLQKTSMLSHYVAFTVDFPEELVENLAPDLLPQGWRSSPPSAKTQSVGPAWVARGSSVLLRVPSVIVVHEHNYLINPVHNDFSRLAISGPSPLHIDGRLFEKKK
jgi:RES domain-containing protein